MLADREDLEEIRDQERAEAEFLEQSLDKARVSDDTIFCGDGKSEDELLSVYQAWRKGAGAALQDFDWGQSFRELHARMVDNADICKDLRQWLDGQKSTRLPEAKGAESALSLDDVDKKDFDHTTGQGVPDADVEPTVLNPAQAAAVGVLTSHAAALKADPTTTEPLHMLLYGAPALASPW